VHEEPAKEGIMPKRKWSDLSPRERRFAIVAGILEACLKAAMLIDLRRRPADQIRGPKWMWTLLTFVNFFGPVAYFAYGRRQGD
jgi:hypothetical protein